MIYTIFENLATVIESAILFGFLIFTLAFKDTTLKRKIVTTCIFFALLISAINVLNYYFTIEGIFISAYCLILFLYCRIILQGEWRHQLLLILTQLAAIFLVNGVISIISAMILNKTYSDILLMRDPLRLFLLFLSKIALICLLIPIGNAVRERKFILDPLQSLVGGILLIASIAAGSAIQKIMLDKLIPTFYTTIIMICLIIISILLLFIIAQLSFRNKAMIKQMYLETRLKDDEIKLKESIQWNNSVKTLQHDLKNHMTILLQYLKSDDTASAVRYIEKINGSIYQYPQCTDTNDPAVNALVDLKRTICRKEKIDLKCYILNELPEFDDVTFSIVFGNLMDNAIEAENKEELQNRQICISIDILGSFLHITIQNRITAPICINGKLPETTKKDTNHHGFGLYSVTEAIKSCNGTIEFTENNGWFIVNVLIPVINKCS